MKTTRHSLMAKGILVLLSLLIMVFIFTYSWYMDPETPVEASGLSFTTRNTSTDFQYAIGFSSSMTRYDYTYTDFTSAGQQDLNLMELYPHGVDKTDPDVHPVNLLYDYKPTDVTGDGVTLIRPAMRYGNWSINYASTNYSNAVENEQYISFDLIFRTKTANTTIKLDADSYARANCETRAGDGSLLNDTASRNKEGKYGPFSVDAIVGAVRVAFLEYAEVTGQTYSGADVLDDEKFDTYASTPKLLWIPRPDIYLNNNPEGSDNRDDQTTGWTLNTNVTSKRKFNLVSRAQDKSQYSTYEHQYYNIFDSDREETGIVTYSDSSVVKASVLDSSAPAGKDKVTFGTQADLVQLKYLDDKNGNNILDGENEWYYGKIRVRIWLEGTDSEARRALAGGKFNISFHITG